MRTGLEQAVAQVDFAAHTVAARKQHEREIPASEKHALTLTSCHVQVGCLMLDGVRGQRAVQRYRISTRILE